jgi:hypothetical protein
MDRHVARERQRVFDAFFADVAPRTNNVGNDIDLQRLQGHGVSSQ